MRSDNREKLDTMFCVVWLDAHDTDGTPQDTSGHC